MEYRPQHPTDVSTDWKLAIANSKKNFEHLEKIDKLVKKEGEILHRSFSLPVADGLVFYQVTKIKKKTAVVKLCEGICLDEYADAVLGDEAEISLSKVKEFLRRKDALARIFG